VHGEQAQLLVGAVVAGKEAAHRGGVVALAVHVRVEVEGQEALGVARRGVDLEAAVLVRALADVEGVLVMGAVDLGGVDERGHLVVGEKMREIIQEG